MYKIICLNCNRIFEVEYKNDRTYCDCKLPYDLQYVPAYDEWHPRLIELYHSEEVEYEK